MAVGDDGGDGEVHGVHVCRGTEPFILVQSDGELFEEGFGGAVRDEAGQRKVTGGRADEDDFYWSRRSAEVWKQGAGEEEREEGVAADDVQEFFLRHLVDPESFGESIYSKANCLRVEGTRSPDWADV